MKAIYDFGIYVYVLAIRIAAIYHPKAKLLAVGRKNAIANVVLWRKQNVGKLYWFHCASLGEFEQGRPLLEAIKKQQPEVKLLLTFFSPSGYEIRKNYEGADHICYLPADTPFNAMRFVKASSPNVVFFVKYEYWANYFFELKKKHIPLYMVSAILRPDQRFFGFAQSFWQNVLGCVTHFFVQNESTNSLLTQHGFTNTTLSGDTRFDRVLAMQQNSAALLELEEFVRDSFCIIGGSTWQPDEDLLIEYFKQNKSIHSNIKLIIVPHEIDSKHIESLCKKLPEAKLWSQCKTINIGAEECVIIDTIGLLSSLYRNADVALIGGGFGKGIHNTLEAAVWSKPILFGPNHQQFEEAKGLIKCGAAISIAKFEQLEKTLNSLITNNELINEMAQAAGLYVRENVGATDKIVARAFLQS